MVATHSAAWWLVTQQGRCNNELISEFKEYPHVVVIFVSFGDNNSTKDELKPYIYIYISLHSNNFKIVHLALALFRIMQ